MTISESRFEAAGLSTIAAILAGLLAIAGTVTPVRAATMDFRIDTDASEVTAAAEEPLSAVRGWASASFRVSSGEVEGDPANVTASARVTLTINAASYRSSSSFRDRAVKSGALEVDKFPAISFTSKRLEDMASADQHSGTATIVGDLTLHGTKREIRVPMRAQLDKDGTLTTDGEFSLRYDDFGVAVPTAMFGAMRAGNVAKVKFHIVARETR